MRDKPKELSDTASRLLATAALRDDHLIRPLQLPVAAVRQLVRSMLNAGLIVELPAKPSTRLMLARRPGW